MPVKHRHWFMNRLVRHFEERKNAIENSKSNNTSESNKQNNLDKFNAFQNQIKNKFN